MLSTCLGGGKRLAKCTLYSVEERYQSGSDERVLVNRLEIIDEEEMEGLESGLLLMCISPNLS